MKNVYCTKKTGQNAHFRSIGRKYLSEEGNVGDPFFTHKKKGDRKGLPFYHLKSDIISCHKIGRCPSVRGCLRVLLCRI